ncbi:MAG: transporter substrate-binding domain-containing protein [Neisseriaceae bacterium]|nr:transporter substrate-binding domain-containing protein [Neisseriaceae bacterium]MBR3482766.1 transporter substrate-binding domain-containing protein [Neisseriaceae bacterium]
MKLKTKHFLLAGLLALPLFFTACSDNQYSEAMPDNVENLIRPNNYTSDKVYTFMAEPSKMPLTARDEVGNNLIGFEVDLLTEIGKRENFEIKTRPQALSGLVRALDEGSADIIGSGLTVTDDMKNQVDFTQFYMTVGYVLLVKEDDSQINSIPDLVGKRLLVQEGTTAQEIANAALILLANNSNAKVDAHIQVSEGTVVPWETTSVPTVYSGIRALATGEADAMLLDMPLALYYQKRKELGLKVIPLKLKRGEQYAFAVRKGRKELRQKINSGLGKVLTDGTYRKLYRKWFDSDPTW